MNIDDLTLGQIKQIQSMCGGGTNSPQTCVNELVIVVLQRGWVIVGHLTINGTVCEMLDARVVRRWGTTDGLGELAKEGPLKNSMIESPCPQKFHTASIVTRFVCDSGKWK